MWKAMLTEIVAQDFRRRCATNPRYSLRAYAGKLGISPGSLSGLMSGKGNWSPSPSRAAEMIERTGATTREKNACLVEMGLHPKFDFVELGPEVTNILRSWYMYPVLFSFDLDPPFRTAAAIAKRLNLKIEQVDEAIATLQKAGLLEMRDGSLQRNQEQFLKTSDSVSKEAIREFHKNGFRLAEEALENCPVDDRYMTSLTFAGSKSQIERIRQQIQELYLKSSSLLDKEDERDTVYRLAVQLFPV